MKAGTFAYAAGVVVAFWVWLTFLDPALATASPRRSAIALVTPGARPELDAHLRAELSALGWRVLEIDPAGDVALAQIARRASTLAVLRVGQQAEGIEVWVAPEVDGEARSEWIDVDRRRPDLAVVRAVEALRARFLELGIEPENDRDLQHARRPPKASHEHEPGSPSDADAAVLAAPLLQLWLGAEGALLSAHQGVSLLQPYLAGRVGFEVNRSLSLGVEVWWSPAALALESREGSATIRAVLAAASGEYRHWVDGLGFGAGGGVALVSLDMSGNGAEGYDGQRDSVLTALPFIRGSLALPLSLRLRLRAEVTGGISLPRAVVRFGGREVASWGRPLLGAALGVEGAILNQ